MMDGCACWVNNNALGHDGHCCFVRDDKNRKINNGFREDADVCHIPECCRLAGKVGHIHHGPPNNRVTLPHIRPRPGRWRHERARERRA